MSAIVETSYRGRAVRLGRMPSRNDPRTIRLARYLDWSKRAQNPTEVRWDKKAPDDGWGVMGNDDWGNCVIVAAAHQKFAWEANESGVTKRLSDAEVIALSKQMGATDGYNILDRLNWWRTKGMWNDFIWAFASTNHHDHELTKLGINEFGGLDIGVNMPTAWQDSDVWDAGRGRTYTPGTWGGHSVPIIGYDAQYLYVVTWGDIVKMTWAALDEYVDEAYVSISPDWFAKDATTPSGFDLPALHDDLFRITDGHIATPKGWALSTAPRPRIVCVAGGLATPA